MLSFLDFFLKGQQGSPLPIFFIFINETMYKGAKYTEREKKGKKK
jgi:hypothetical protein